MDGEPAHRSRVTRRTAIGVGAAAVVLAVGIPTAWSLLSTASGKLVTPLLASHPFYIAHHGGSADWPEMSMEAYRNSVARRVDALEISLARTSDGVWFGLHDATLDRTSGTQGFVAAEHTWAEVSEYRISAAGTDNPRQAAQPYLRFEQLVKAYGQTHTIFVDPKVVASTYYPELVKMMETGVRSPKQTFIAKGYCTQTQWAELARAHGYHTWGFYYANEIEANTTPLQATESSWTVLGLNYLGSDATWKLVRSLGKPVIAHIIPTKAAASTALAKGADGLMVSGVTQVL